MDDSVGSQSKSRPLFTAFLATYPIRLWQFPSHYVKARVEINTTFAFRLGRQPSQSRVRILILSMKLASPLQRLLLPPRFDLLTLSLARVAFILDALISRFVEVAFVLTIERPHMLHDLDSIRNDVRIQKRFTILAAWYRVVDALSATTL